MKKIIFLLLLSIGCAKEKNLPNDVTKIHVTNSSGSFTVTSWSGSVNSVEIITGNSFDKTFETPHGDYAVFQCQVENTNSAISSISISITKNNGTPATASNPLTSALSCQGNP